MPDTPTHPYGTFCWIELATTDAGAAKAFYGALFGWELHDTPAGPSGTYTIARLDGADVAALYAINAAQAREGVPPHWGVYLAVDDVGAHAARVKELGGTILAEPFDVMDAGRMAVARDPQGATFCLWEARRHAGLGRTRAFDTLTWNELQTDDPKAAAAFYTALFGWTAKGAPEYVEVVPKGGGGEIAGIMGKPPGTERVPPHWLTYFSVEDCDAKAARAKELGGRAVAGPLDIPNVGRFAVIRDPQGAVFAIVRLQAAPSA